MYYYITCLMSGVVELGSVLWGIGKGYSVSMIIGIALAYQFGNVIRFFVTPQIAKYESVWAGIVVMLSVTIKFMQPGSVLQYIATLFMFGLFSTILQNVRSSLQGNIPRWQKRTSRVVGFLLSAVIYILPEWSMIVLSGLLFFFSVKTPNYSYKGFFDNWRKGALGEKICWSMVTHQAHYFAYNYLLLIMIMAAFGKPWIATACFALNWIPYTIAEPLIQKLKWNNWKQLAVFAHLFNAVVLLLMYYFVSGNIFITIGLWVLTGFGGGNVFCIKKALASKVRYDKNVWSLSEQIGHIVGVVSALGISVWCREISVSMVVAAIYALVTIPVILMTLRRGTK